MNIPTTGMEKKIGLNFLNMSNFAFCTIAYGKKYIELSKTLISQVSNLGEKIFVYTNNVAEFESNENVILIPYTKEYFSFHEKTTVVRECLKHYDTAVFLDCDVVLQNIEDLSFLEDAKPGLHIFATFGSVGNTFFSDDISLASNSKARNTKYGQEGIDFIEKLGYRYKKVYHLETKDKDFIEHFLEGKWILKKEAGKEEAFLRIWEELQPFCEEFDIRYGYFENVGAGEGAAMAIACYNSGITFSTIGPLYSTFTKNFISNYKEKTDGTKPWNIAG